MELKEIMERKAKIRARMNAILTSARTENRAVSEEEGKEFDELEKELAGLERTEQLEQRAINLKLSGTAPESAADKPDTSEKRAESTHKYPAVDAYIRGSEIRAGEMSTSENGVIATDFSNDIIRMVKELSGIISRVSVVNSKGDYKQIVTDEANKITAGWKAELAEVTSSEAKFTDITIGHHTLGALFKVSNELINQNYFDIASEGADQMSLDFALKTETAVIKGTGSGQPTGLTSAGTEYNLLSNAAITADELIAIQHALKAPYQMNAVWLMSNNTLCRIRQLKDEAGQYVFHLSDMTSGFSGTVLGKPVLISEAMDNIGAGKIPILYGDFGRAYKVNLNPDVSIQVLREKYATQNCIGVLGFMYIDGKPVNSEAYVSVKCPGNSPGSLGVLTVTSSAGTNNGDTAITVSPAKAASNSYRYMTDASAAPSVVYGQDVSSWNTWDGSADITAAAGTKITVVEADSSSRAVKAGSATVTAKS